MTIAELSRWLSQVCEVITDPSAEALHPTMIEVQARASAAQQAPNNPIAQARDGPNFRGHRRAAMVDENGTVPLIAGDTVQSRLFRMMPLHLGDNLSSV
jgi:hypothetical protein